MTTDGIFELSLRKKLCLLIRVYAYRLWGRSPKRHTRCSWAEGGTGTRLEKFGQWARTTAGGFCFSILGFFVLVALGFWVYGAGGEWIDSPAGAYRPAPRLVGKANFYIEMWNRGDGTLTGETKFQFKAAALNFYSSRCEALVMNRSKVQCNGSGTINGVGDYQFALWVGDGAPDTFRIRIWREADRVKNVLYDNGFDQAIGGGSIKIVG